MDPGTTVWTLCTLTGILKSPSETRENIQINSIFSKSVILRTIRLTYSPLILHHRTPSPETDEANSQSFSGYINWTHYEKLIPEWFSWNSRFLHSGFMTIKHISLKNVITEMHLPFYSLFQKYEIICDIKIYYWLTLIIFPHWRFNSNNDIMILAYWILILIPKSFFLNLFTY